MSALGGVSPFLTPPVTPQPLISRSYKGDVGLGEIEHFMGVLLQREEEGTLTPVLTYGHVHFLWIKHANLYRILRDHPQIPPRDPPQPREPPHAPLFLNPPQWWPPPRRTGTPPWSSPSSTRWWR